MKLTKRINIPLFKTWWTVIITDDLQAALKSIGANTEVQSHQVAFTTSNDYIVFHKDHVEAGLIAHECTHAAIQIMQDIAQDPLKAEECLAYTVEYLVNQITELAKKHNL